MEVEGAGIERIQVLRIPMDIVPQEQLAPVVLDLLHKRNGGGIVLLSVWDLLKARRKSEYRNYIEGASLVIPISKSLVKGARFLTGKTPVRYMPFDFIVSILSILERGEHSAYLLGGNARILQKAENNVRETFPGVMIVGRFSTPYRKAEEGPLMEAIRKAQPALLLVGKGIRGGEAWLARNSDSLNKGFRLWCSDIFDIFADRRKRPSRAVFNRGLEWLSYCAHNPFKLFRIFPFIGFKLLLLFYRLFKTKPPKEGAPGQDAAPAVNTAPAGTVA
jgi:N-acetylglucosaminyldiphosphoundecaprenol N-acetyl-beta-D-mannosaminyltransferase